MRQILLVILCLTFKVFGKSTLMLPDTTSKSTEISHSAVLSQIKQKTSHSADSATTSTNSSTNLQHSFSSVMSNSFLFCITTQDSLEGNKGQPCIFPFNLDGKSYNECTTDFDPDGKLWCATETDESDKQVTNKWGYCPNKCDSCKPGFYKTDENDMDKKGNCSNCLCYIEGSLKSDNTTCTAVDPCPCNADGVCTCSTGYTGDKCDVCASEYFKSDSLCQPQIPPTTTSSNPTIPPMGESNFSNIGPLYNDQRDLINMGKGISKFFIFNKFNKKTKCVNVL